MVRRDTKHHVVNSGVIVTNVGATKRNSSSQCPCHPRLGQGQGKCSHEYFADPVRLFHVVCRFGCGASLDYSRLRSRDVPYYLQIRRRTEKLFGLLSVAAPLDCNSTRLLGDSSIACGIISSTAILHLTYVDGLWPECHQPIEINEIRLAIRQAPTMMIDCVHLIHRTDKNIRLVVADVSVDENVQRATDKIANGDCCTLPQFPFHVVLGYAESDFQDVLLKAQHQLVGKKLKVSAERVKILAPIDFDSWSPWCEVDDGDEYDADSTDLSIVTRKTSNRLHGSIEEG